MKKVLSVFLVVVMMFSMMALPSNAATQVEQIIAHAKYVAENNPHGYDGACLAFVGACYKSAGYSHYSMGTAYNAGSAWIVSTSSTNIPVGALVFYDYTWHSTAGHVGIYAGNGQMYDAQSSYGGVKLRTFKTNGYRGWGWYGGIEPTGGSSAPTDVWISLPNGDESSYKIGETVNIKFGATNATRYELIMFKYQDKYWEGVFDSNGSNGRTCPASFDSVGHYCCYVVAKNSSGQIATSRWVGWDIVEEKPTNLGITTNKGKSAVYSTQETINFTLSATFGYYKHIGIHKTDGTTSKLFKEADVSGTNYSIVINEPGNYYANFDAFNTYGTTRSEMTYFTVVDSPPDYAELSIDGGNKQTYAIGETIKFNLSTINNENKYIGIHKDGSFYKGSWVDGDFYQYTFAEKGSYYTDFESINSCGSIFSNIVYFEVVDKCSLNYMANQNIWKTEGFAVGVENEITKEIPTRIGYIFKEWNTKADGKGISYQPGDTYSENADLTLYAIWERDTFGLINDSPLVYDADNKFIYGNNILSMSAEEIAGIFNNSNKVINTNNGIIGTGTTVNLIDETNTVYDTATVVVFGDVNGDGYFDGEDSIVVSAIVNDCLSKDSLSEAELFAADCNHDNVIDSNDIVLLEQAGLLNQTVKQEI